MIPLSLPVPMADVANHLGFLFFFLVDVGLVLGFLRSSVLKATSANEAWSAPEREPLCDSRCGPLHSVSVTLGVIQPVLVSSQVSTPPRKQSWPKPQSQSARVRLPPALRVCPCECGLWPCARRAAEQVPLCSGVGALWGQVQSTGLDQDLAYLK